MRLTPTRHMILRLYLAFFVLVVFCFPVFRAGSRAEQALRQGLVVKMPDHANHGGYYIAGTYDPSLETDVRARRAFVQPGMGEQHERRSNAMSTSHITVPGVF
jgi:hypothetical protein